MHSFSARVASTHVPRDLPSVSGDGAEMNVQPAGIGALNGCVGCAMGFAPIYGHIPWIKDI